MKPEFDWMLFIGRFHSLLVHLPLGFLLLATLMEVFSVRLKKDYLSSAAAFAWFVGAISAILSVAVGFLLISDGSYSGVNLTWHKWMGISVAILSALCWLSKQQIITRKIYFPSISLLMLSILLTGHLGGNLTHGEQYLFEYAPQALKSIVGQGGNISQNKIITDQPDSLRVFHHLVQPILDQKCVNCHNVDKKKGDLVLTTAKQIEQGGDGGAVLKSGSPSASELFRRVILSADDPKFMPPSGDALTYDEIQILKWWIAGGANFDQTIRDLEKDEEIVFALSRSWDLDVRKKPFIELVKVSQVEDVDLQVLREAGFKVNRLTANSPLLDVSYIGKSISSEALEALIILRGHVVFLDLSDSGLGNEHLSFVVKCENLVKLKLNGNHLTNQGISQLGELEHLESVNLYGNDIDGESLDILAQIPSLKNLYLWQTKVTQADIESLMKSRSDLDIDLGFSFTPG
ncbi:MAG: hypothetical protein KI790_03925 [Cyclobacteriaceae bacterium]|nr:hypothetical protein [Cyclobacteriaceae bacterium HetDA_MAG_MS6]